jgi:hypothetical protein
MRKKQNENCMKKALRSSLKSSLIAAGVLAAASVFIGTASAQTLVLRVPLSDTNGTTTLASDTSTGGSNVVLQMVNNAGAPADFQGVPGSGVGGGVALDFSTNADFTLGVGEGAGAGLGPMAAATNVALNFGTNITNFTASIWLKANAQMTNAGGNSTLGPRIFILGANGTTDKAVTNSVGLFFQQWNQVACTVDTIQLNAPTNLTYVPTNQWLFYAITYDGTTITLYQGSDTSEATAVASVASPGLTISLTNTAGSVLMLGNRVNGLSRPFDGWLDDFRFYAGTATPTTVEDIRFATFEGTNPTNGPGNGVNILANPGFETGSFANWTTYNQANIQSTNALYCAGCTPKGTSNVLSHSGEYVGNSYNSDFTAGSVNYNGAYQNIPSVAASTYYGYGWAYTSSQDLMGTTNSFWFELEFLNSSNQLLTLWQSAILSNAPTQFPDNVWLYMPITNQYQVTAAGTSNAAATTTIIGNTGPLGIITAPVGTATVRYQVVFRANAYEGGSAYYDDNYLDLVSGPSPPYLTNVTALNNVILATNTSFSFTAVSPTVSITNIVVVASTHALGGGTTNTVTNSITSTNMTITGLNTGSTTVTIPLQSNTVYSLSITATDQNGLPIAATENFDTIVPTLVIEFEDFNYSGGGYMNTPPDGGLALYTNQLGVAGIDEFGSWNVPAGVQGYYRPGEIAVIQAAAPDNGTEQKYIISEAAGDTRDVPVEVGYNLPNDGLNYTRDFGSSPTNSAPAGTYAIWARLATDGDGIPGVGFGIVTNDPTQNTQGVNPLGTFNFTDTDWNGFVYVPLLNQFGTPVSVNLTGHETFRETMMGNVNMDFFMLMPVTPVLTPILSYIYPDGAHPFEYTNVLDFTIGAANGAGIPKSGIDLVVNGVDVTSLATFSGATNSWSVSYPLKAQTTNSLVISVTNSAGLTLVISKTFDTFNPTNFQFEANDYDFSTNGPNGEVGGLFIDNPVPTADTTKAQAGEFATNSYFGYPMDLTGIAIAQLGVDYTDKTPPTLAEDPTIYRADNNGSQPASDYLRPKFIAAQQQFNDPNIGPFNLGWTTTGDWDNYTRHYPTGNYNVWGRIAGGSTAWTGQLVQMVTSGFGTTNQTTNTLGTLSDPAPAGYQAWHWIPALDANGNMVVVALGGQATLRMVCGGPGVNEEFYMLVPATSGPVSLNPAIVGGQLNISFATASGHNYTVLYKPTLLNTNWTQVGSVITGNGSTQTATETLTGTQGYYKVLVQ